jgi:fatty acid desaturase
MVDQVEKAEPELEDIDVDREHLRLTLDIAQKQYEYKIERRPLIWYRNIILFDFLLFLIGIGVIGILGSNTFYGGWTIFFSFIFAIIFIGMSIYFIIDATDGRLYFGFRGIARIKDLNSSRVHMERLQIQLHVIEEFQSAHRPPKHKYADEVSQVIQQYTRKANRNRRFFYAIQMFIIFCSLLVTGLTSGLTSIVKIFSIPWITPAISFAVTFLTAMITLFRFRERSHNQQQTADAIEYEISCATKGIFA